MIIFSLDFLGSIYNSSKVNFKRFPFTILVAAFSSAILIYVISFEKQGDEQLLKAFMTGLLAIPLFFSSEIFEERKLVPRFLPRGLILVYLIGFYYFISINDLLFDNNVFIIKYFVLLAVAHLLASVSPYFFHDNINSFWQYNKILFLNILTSLVYSVTLGVGITLAMLGVKALFEIEIKDYWFGNVWIFLVGILNTKLFLSKIPDLKTIDQEDDYPIGLKYFTQYVLLPLVSIYLVILLSYEIKILGTWSLPKGWISIMVLLSAVFGILAFLLIYPLQKTNTWIRNFTRYYYYTLIPLVALMAAAIYFRINQYGISEPRYYVASLTVWLLFVSIYFILSKKDDIRIIPISLIVLGLWGVYSPLGAHKTSVNNQKRRLTQTLKKYNLIELGKIKPNDKVQFDDKDTDKVFSALEYLSKSNYKTLEPLLSADAYKLLSNEENEYNRFNKVKQYLKYPQKERINDYRYFSLKRASALPLENADYLLESENLFDKKIDVNNADFNFKLSNNKLNVFTSSTDKLTFDLSLINSNFDNEMPLSQLSFYAENKEWKGKLILKTGNFNKETLENISWMLFLTKKSD